MSGHRWFTVSLCSVVSLLLAGCQSDGSSHIAWNPFARRAPKSDVTSGPSFSLPKFARREADKDLGSDAEKAVPLIADGRIDSLLEEGQLALQENRLDDAQKAYQEVLSAAPDNATAHHGTAMASDLCQQWADAEYHYKQALRIRPRDANLLCDIGYSYVLQSRYSEASRYLNQAIEVNPQHESAQMNLALLDLRQGNRAAAEERIAQRFGSSAAATQVLAQLEARIAASGNSVVKPGASSVVATDATLEQVQAQAARERVEAEQRRALQGTQPPVENQMPPRMMQPPLQAPAITDQANGSFGQYPAPGQSIPSNAGGNFQSLPHSGLPSPVTGQVAGNAAPLQPGFSGGPRSGMIVGQNPNAATQSGTTASPAAWPGNSSALPMTGFPNSAPSYETPRGSAPMPGRVVPVHASGTFQTPPSTGVSYGQPVGFGAPQGQYSVNTVNGLNNPQNGVQESYSPGMQGATAASQAPQVHLAGLNVGPGALFPIGQSAQSGDPSAMSLNGTGYGGAPVSAATMTAVQSGTRGGGSAGEGGLQMGNVSAPGSNSMINGTMYGQPTSILPAQEWAIRQQQIQQSQNRIAPGGINGAAGSAAPGAWPSALPPQANPLAGYERQLQQIDTQYNNALQQMDGRSPLSAPTAH